MNARLTIELCTRNVAPPLVEHPWVLRPAEAFEEPDFLNADFAYIRWLGDGRPATVL
jgi:hypothetical protein